MSNKISRLYKKKWFRIPYLTFLYLFALYGFFLVGTYLAMKFQWTKDGGQVDVNNRYFQSMSDKYNQSFKVDSVSMVKHRFEVLNRIILLNEFYPQNAQHILAAYQDTKDEKLVLQMLDAIDIRLINNKKYQKAMREFKAQKIGKKVTGLSVYEWMNIAEWKCFKEAVAKDKKYIDSAAQVTGVEPRYIVACLVGEQVRLFNSRREKYKDFIAPLKTLALENNMSYGVTGIKEFTAHRIENYLKDSTSIYYLGNQYAHLLDYDTVSNYTNNINDTMSLRVQRLVQFTNHYYSYLYAAVFIKQIRTQWQKAGFPIDNRPEIFASLFNLGYSKSVPKKRPEVGGSVFKIREQEYTFGAVAYEFYFSGELVDLFPYKKKHFDWDED
ncbi:MAG: hypothetical protein HYR91_10785 [Flavobacteriia bacterium]|nr:hypothetical protein [Flavobacteriia bacterium]